MSSTADHPVVHRAYLKRVEILGLLSEGFSRREVMELAACSKNTVARALQRAGGTPIRRPRRSRNHLSLLEREEIAVGVARGESRRAIARRLGRAPSTISREVMRGGGSHRYRAVAADNRAAVMARRPKRRKLDATPALVQAVEHMLLELSFSPKQISATLRRELPNDEELNISHETIYQTLYLQSRGQLRKNLTSCLRTGRARRIPRNTTPGKRGRIPGMINISERPPEAADRAVPGHWEGDLIIGRNGRSQIATLVERHTRFVMLAAVDSAKTVEVTNAVALQMEQLPEHLRRSLAWDQGREMTAHARFTIRTGIPVFFCDPHSPWQRGSNENTNGLLRQFFPKGTDLSQHDQDRLDEVARLMNIRPRETLNWDSPAERMKQLLLR